MTAVSDASPSKAQVSHNLRQHVAAHLYHECEMVTPGVAIYALSDPRSLREPRYIGQTADPGRRFLQHLNTARLWLPDDLPWWVKSPRMRPLYEWIRALYRDECRLPTMVVTAWIGVDDNARAAERARICESLVRQDRLLNVEPRLTGEQFLLL
jgi:hypothetical protein